MGELGSTHIQESSGIVAGRVNPGMYWTHNDSGSSGPRVWAVALETEPKPGLRELGYVELTGASNSDWEDISAGPDGYLYIFDGGDNPPCNREDKRIHRFREPVIAPGKPLARKVAVESIRFEYPHPEDRKAMAQNSSQRYDAECLMVHPSTGDLYVVTKRSNQDVPVARVYKIDAKRAAWKSKAVVLLEYLGDITATLELGTTVLTSVTAGDISPDGSRLMLRHYSMAFEFEVPAAGPFEAAFASRPVPIGLPGEIQGEGLCYDLQGRFVISTSEVRNVMGQPLLYKTCPFYISRPVRAGR